MNTDVAIIGGGLTGLMMARALSVTGVSICLLDRSAGDHGMADDRTTTIHAAGMRMLDTLGISDHLPDAATPIMRIAVAEGAPLTGLAARRRPDSDLSWQASEDPLAYVVRNADLQAALMAALASTISPASSASTGPKGKTDGHGNLQIMRGATLAGMTRDGASMQLEIDSGHGNPNRLTAGLVVACDGANSHVARLAELPAREERHFQTAIVSILRAERPHQNTAFQRFLPGGPFALMPMAGHRLSLVWTMPAAEAETLMVAAPQMFEAACMEAFGQSLGYLHLDGQRLAWPLRPSVRRRIAAPGVVLAGDAAHALHPIAGQGYNLALGDAAVLADCLARARARGLTPDHPSVWHGYEEGRRAERFLMSAATSGINQLFARSPTMVRRLAGAGFAMLERTRLKNMFSDIATGGRLTRAALLEGRYPGRAPE